MSRSRIVLAALLTATAVPGVAACGARGRSSSRQTRRSGGGLAAVLRGTASDNTGAEGKRGGRITLLAAGDVDFIDPGRTYYSVTISLLRAAHRTLYSYRPDSTKVPIPDLAATQARIAPDGRTVTVKIRKGVRYSPPVGREVKSADVKYAIERGFTRSVSNGYAAAYFGDLMGAPRTPGNFKEIAGIQTPDEHTIVFRLSRATLVLRRASST